LHQQISKKSSRKKTKIHSHTKKINGIMNLSLKVKGEIREWNRPAVMGIVNCTPDSFYSSSCMLNGNLFSHIDRIIADGADFLDIGGMSSRPGAKIIDQDEEWERIKPALEYVNEHYPEIPVSVDTFRSEIARRAYHNYGVDLINDISGGQMDDKMISTVGELGIGYIGMHMRGNPQTMQSLTQYQNLMLDLSQYFGQLKLKCIENGISDLIIDPGIGFAKNIDQNYHIINNLHILKALNLPILMGISRKSLIYKYLNILPEDSLPGTIALNALSIVNGANILRVHDVKECVQTVLVVQKTLTSN